MANIKAILFDLDDTLLWDERSVKEAFQATCAAATKKYVVDPQQLEDAVREQAQSLYATYDTIQFTRDIGINPFEGLWGNFNDTHHPMFRRMKEIVPQYRVGAWTRGLKMLGIDDPVLGKQLAELFPKERRSRPIVYEETFSILDSLKTKYKLLLLTNGSPELQNEKLAAIPPLSEYFDHIVISGAFGKGKPDRSIFEHALQLLEIEPNEGIMVGDKLTTDILGANNTGIHSVWINRKQMPNSAQIIPDFEIQHLNELFPILEKLNQ